MTGRGKIEKPSPHGEGGEHSEPDRVENHTGHESKNLGTNCPYLYLEGESVKRSYDTMINFGEIR